MKLCVTFFVWQFVWILLLYVYVSLPLLFWFDLLLLLMTNISHCSPTHSCHTKCDVGIFREEHTKGAYAHRARLKPIITIIVIRSIRYQINQLELRICLWRKTKAQKMKQIDTKPKRNKTILLHCGKHPIKSNDLGRNVICLKCIQTNNNKNGNNYSKSFAIAFKIAV